MCQLSVVSPSPTSAIPAAPIQQTSSYDKPQDGTLNWPDCENSHGPQVSAAAATWDDFSSNSPNVCIRNDLIFSRGSETWKQFVSDVRPLFTPHFVSACVRRQPWCRSIISPFPHPPHDSRRSSGLVTKVSQRSQIQNPLPLLALSLLPAISMKSNNLIETYNCRSLFL